MGAKRTIGICGGATPMPNAPSETGAFLTVSDPGQRHLRRRKAGQSLATIRSRFCCCQGAQDASHLASPIRQQLADNFQQHRLHCDRRGTLCVRGARDFQPARKRRTIPWTGEVHATGQHRGFYL